ncbi:MAG: 2OG-Fe(II) oxygenase [Rhodospirillales bacterium]|nr:2OG-Fe(II) oxygenase [Rhodospirillales bacterium]
MADDIGKIINLQRYPIHDGSTPACHELVAGLRADLDRNQFCILPDFIHEHVREELVGEVEGLQDVAFANRSQRNCYLQRNKDPETPDDHPRNIFFEASYRMIASDSFAESSALKRLYYWQPMIDFVARIVGADKLYVNADPFQPVSGICYGDGDRSAWHFDSWNEFTMTLMLQSPEGGGEFEIVPNIRSREDPNHDELRTVLQGDRARVVTVPRSHRALVIFRGARSVHRVTPVSGSTKRLMAVFVYEKEPGVLGDPEVNATVYGPRTQMGQ